MNLIDTYGICCCSSVSKLSDSFETPWTVAFQAPLSMGFPRQEYWSVLHFLFQGVLLTHGSNLHLLHCRQILYLFATWHSLSQISRIHIFKFSFGFFTELSSLLLQSLVAALKACFLKFLSTVENLISNLICPSWWLRW